MSYEEKYLKYKNKYLNLVEQLGSGRFGENIGSNKIKSDSTIEKVQLPKGKHIIYKLNTQTVRNVVAFHDPAGTGLSKGDVDDWYAMLYEALLYGNKLLIVIVNAEPQSLNRFATTDIQSLIKIIESYGSTVISENDLTETHLEHKDIGFICAPLNDKLIELIKNSSITKLYMQGLIDGELGYNFKESSAIAKTGLAEFGEKLIDLPTTGTKLELPINRLTKSYKQFNFFPNLQNHVLRQLMGLATPTLAFAFGLIVAKETLKDQFFPNISNYVIINEIDYVKYGGFGNTAKNIDNMYSLLIEQKLITSSDMENNKLIDQELKLYLDQYSNSLCNTLIDMIKKNHPDQPVDTHRTEILTILLDIVRPVINKMGVIASIVLIDPKSIVDSKKKELCNMGSLPLLKTKDIQYYKETPSLFDFVAVLLVSLYPDYTKQEYNAKLKEPIFKNTVLYYFNVMFNLLSQKRSFKSIEFY